MNTNNKNRLLTEPEQKDIPMLPDGCGYEGHDFGASYPDSKCYGGKLYDLDNCDNAGNLYEPLDYIPCPECHHNEWREQFKEELECEGYEAAESGKLKTECPHPKSKLKYPQDGPWMRRCWMRGWKDYHKENKR